VIPSNNISIVCVSCGGGGSVEFSTHFSHNYQTTLSRLGKTIKLRTFLGTQLYILSKRYMFRTKQSIIRIKIDLKISGKMQIILLHYDLFFGV